MAITRIDFAIWSALEQQGVLPEEPDVLEIGEANWYGDVPVDDFPVDVDPFETARNFYWETFRYDRIDAIDLHSGTGRAWKYDLNEPVPVPHRYDIVINTGTTEHIWNQHQVFKTIHDLTLPGGLMYHQMPMTGWLDHGFVCYQPTFIADLAAANRYQIVLWMIGCIATGKAVQVKSLEDIHALDIQPDSSMFVVLRRPPVLFGFATPQQGYYAAGLSDSASGDWHRLKPKEQQ